VQLLRVTLDGGDVLHAARRLLGSEAKFSQGYYGDTEFPTQAIETLAKRRRMVLNQVDADIGIEHVPH